MALCLGITPLSANTIDFDLQNEFEEQFVSVGSTTPAWNSKVGMNGHGGLLAGNTGYVAATQQNNPLSLKPGQSITVSMAFHYTSQTSRISERNAGIYLTTQPNSSPIEQEEGALIAIYLYNVNKPPASDQTKLGYSIGGEHSFLEPGFVLAEANWWNAEELADRWVELKVRFTKLPTDGLWEVDVTILDRGLDGDLEGTEIFSINIPEISAKKLYDGRQVYVGFQNLRNDRGFRSMDQFRAILE